MANTTGMMPFNGHRIQGRSSEEFINAPDVIRKLKLKKDAVFMDAGCGDAHAALDAAKILGPEAKIYGVDIYEDSINDLNKTIKEKQLKNVHAICSDITKHIDCEDNLFDCILSINCFHGFNKMKRLDEAIEELKRITKTGGKISIVDFKKMEAPHGPGYKARISEQFLEEAFAKHNMKMINCDTTIGEDLEGGIKSHYLIEFQK